MASRQPIDLGASEGMPQTFHRVPRDNTIPPGIHHVEGLAAGTPGEGEGIDWGPSLPKDLLGKALALQPPPEPAGEEAAPDEVGRVAPTQDQDTRLEAVLHAERDGGDQGAQADAEHSHPVMGDFVAPVEPIQSPPEIEDRLLARRQDGIRIATPDGLPQPPVCLPHHMVGEDEEERRKAPLGELPSDPFLQACLLAAEGMEDQERRVGPGVRGRK